MLLFLFSVSSLFCQKIEIPKILELPNISFPNLKIPEIKLSKTKNEFSLQRNQENKIQYFILVKKPESLEKYSILVKKPTENLEKILISKPK